MARAILHGIPVASGIAVGKAFFLNHRPVAIPHTLVRLDQVEEEAARLEKAITAVAEEFATARAALPQPLQGQTDLIDSHLLICRDPKLGGEALRRIREHRMNAEWAMEESVAGLAETFNRIDSPYIRDRIQDVRVVADRICGRLAAPVAETAAQGGKGILLAHDLTPADTFSLSPQSLVAFATTQGGKTSHTGILARNLQIPAVVGVSGLEEDIRAGDLLVVDGLRGRILVGPSETELAAYLEIGEQFAAYQKRVRAAAALPAETEDGRRIAVLANIENAAEAEHVRAAGGEGVGLVRTEFGYITRKTLPDEEELYREYARIAAALAPHRVTFRTLDVGADKLFSERKNLDEPNPALGMRAIRYCLRHQDIFRTQLKAILRASAHGNVALMFPLISGLEELRQAKSILNEARQELDAAHIFFDPHVPVGIMIELPSAVMIADALAREADFFSIGTNDLIQYFLGVDRGNRHVAHMHQPLHPAVIRAIKYVVDMAHKVGIAVCVCGEMAADPHCLPVLLGMAVDELSVSPQSIAPIKHLIRRSHVEENRNLLHHALSAGTYRSINAMIRHAVYSRFPEDMSFFISSLDADG